LLHFSDETYAEDRRGKCEGEGFFTPEEGDGLFPVLKIFIPPSASVQLKIEAYHHLLPRVLTPETIESEKKKKKKLLTLYCLRLVTTEA